MPKDYSPNSARQVGSDDLTLCQQRWLQTVPQTTAQSNGAWLRYWQSVYGHKPAAATLSNGSVHFFYLDAPGAACIPKLVLDLGDMPLVHQLWIPKYVPVLAPYGFFVGPAPEDNFSGAVSWMEVMRVTFLEASAQKERRAIGPWLAEAAHWDQTWYWHAPGSGILWNAGRSLRVSSRQELLDTLQELWMRKNATANATAQMFKSAFHIRQRNSGDARTWDKIASSMGFSLCEVVRDVGYDSVQIMHTFGDQVTELVDCRSYAGALLLAQHGFGTFYLSAIRTTRSFQSRWEQARSRLGIANRSIAESHSWDSACTSADLLSGSELQATRKGSRLKKCHCDPSLPILNCAGDGTVRGHKFRGAREAAASNNSGHTGRVVLQNQVARVAMYGTKKARASHRHELSVSTDRSKGSAMRETSFAQGLCFIPNRQCPAKRPDCLAAFARNGSMCEYAPERQCSSCANIRRSRISRWASLHDAPASSTGGFLAESMPWFWDLRLMTAEGRRGEVMPAEVMPVDR